MIAKDMTPHTALSFAIPKGANIHACSRARAEQVLLFGALAMLLLSTSLAAVGAAGRSGRALNAHVHAGSLGWLTLAVLAVAVGMADDGDGDRVRLRSRRWG